MSVLESCGVKAFVIHKVRTFCPTIQALRAATDHCKTKLSDGQSGRGKTNELCHWKLHQRPMFGNRRWKIGDGIVPALTVRASVTTQCWDDEAYLVRMPRHGMGIFTEVETPTDENDLVEREPTDELLDRARDKMQTALGEFGESLGLGKDGLQSTLESLVYDPQVHFDSADVVRQYRDVGRQPSYEIVELQFADIASLRILSSESLLTDEHSCLRKAVLYCLGRSYHVDRDRPADLFTLSDEINEGVFDDFFVPGTHRMRIKNFSQTQRVFVTLGPRGAVLAYTDADNYDHPRVRVSVLNLIELLRGRFHNLVVTRTLLDDTIRSLSDLALDGDGDYRDQDLGYVLKQMMHANYLYGLVVSDPIAYLLDGSMLSRLAENADTYFHLRGLREDTERKMNALQRFWQEFQDQQRTTLIRSFRGTQAP